MRDPEVQEVTLTAAGADLVVASWRGTTPGRRAVTTVDDARAAMRVLLQTALSVGVALCPPVAADVDTLLKRADMAMYESKRGGRGCASLVVSGGDYRRLSV